MFIRFSNLVSRCLFLVLVSMPAWQAVPAAAAAPGTAGDLFVSGDISNKVREYTGTSGAFQGDFCTPSGCNGYMAVHFNAAGTRMLVGSSIGGVEEYDATTGAYIKTYNPGGGWQWAGIYAPNGKVYIGDMFTNDVRAYDATTGAYLHLVCPVNAPADMRVGPNGNLYICSYGGGFVLEVNANNGAFVSLWPMPPGALPNDIAFLPSGEILVTAMRTNVVYRYDSAHNLLGSFNDPFWGNPHGIVISPWTGNILVSDGVVAQVAEFNPVTFAELNANYLVPGPGDKIVDLEFKPAPGSVPVEPTNWSHVKQLFR
jgi:DNA-binding beta-propeller fold protein YncE